ncbi:MAG: adenylate/guanylate cyclase domain-containing protein [Pseudomonadales bacterium]
MPNGVVITTPDLLFRLLGYGGLVLVAVLRLDHDSDAGLWLLLVFAASWPALWWVLVRSAPSLRQPERTAAWMAHTAESLVITALVTTAGLGLWLSVAVALLCLTGVTALGGLRLLLPAACGIGVWFALAGTAGLLAGPADGWSLAGLALAGGFLLALAWLSFARVRRLDARRRSALSESARLKDRNARLARYLPGELPPLIITDPGVLRPTEKFATVAFVDLVGFVALVAARPVMEITEVLNDFMATVVALTERRGGVVGKFLGDGVLIYFADGPNAPVESRRQGATACARVALELGPALAGLSRDWQQRGLSLQVSVRCALASGCCAIGDWGGGERLDYTLIGMPVNLASRLQALAEPGGVLVTATTATLVGHDPELAERLEALGPRHVRGVGTVVVHALGTSAKVRAIPLPGTPVATVEASRPPWTRSS